MININWFGVHLKCFWVVFGLLWHKQFNTRYFITIAIMNVYFFMFQTLSCCDSPIYFTIETQPVFRSWQRWVQRQFYSCEPYIIRTNPWQFTIKLQNAAILKSLNTHCVSVIWLGKKTNKLFLCRSIRNKVGSYSFLLFGHICSQYTDIYMPTAVRIIASWVWEWKKLERLKKLTRSQGFRRQEIGAKEKKIVWLYKDNLPADQTWWRNLPPLHIIIKYQQKSQMKCMSHKFKFIKSQCISSGY